MGKKKHQKTHPKESSPLEEITASLEALHQRLTQVQDLRNEGFPYRDALRARAELQVRETVKAVFGERSSEYQRLKQFKIPSTNEGDIAHALQSIQDLVVELEHQRLEILGIAPAPTSEPLVSIPELHTDHVQPSTPSPIIFTSPSSPEKHQPVQQETLSASSSPPTSPNPPPPSNHTPPASPAQAPELPLQPSGTSSPLPPPSPGSMATPMATAMDMTRPTVPTPPSPPTREGGDTTVTDTVTRVRTIADRFHAVSRQLRLRKDYRTTLEVEDQYDVQDLFGSLLRIDFEEVGSEEWMPDYGGFSSQRTFFLLHGQLAIVLKKTRPGWGNREIAEELASDIKQYAPYEGCAALFCFVYDPEGRIGNPSSLEQQLTTHKDGFSVHVLIAPK